LEHGIIADDDEDAIPSSPPPSPTDEPVPHLPPLPTPSSSETQSLQQQQGSKNGFIDEINLVASDNDALRVYIMDLVDQQQKDSQPPPPPTGDPSV
jgi:hypothetical protein